MMIRIDILEPPAFQRYSTYMLGLLSTLYLCICIFVYLCICVFVYLHICVFVNLCICIFVYLHICVFVYLCICNCDAGQPRPIQLTPLDRLICNPNHTEPDLLRIVFGDDFAEMPSLDYISFNLYKPQI